MKSAGYVVAHVDADTVKLVLPHPDYVPLPAAISEHWGGKQGLSLGDGHWLILNAGYGKPADEAVAGLIVHEKAGMPHGYCGGSITFDEGYGPPVWTVESWSPMTLRPSLLCHCGDHGWIRNGLWVRA